MVNGKLIQCAKDITLVNGLERGMNRMLLSIKNAFNTIILKFNF